MPEAAQGPVLPAAGTLGAVLCVAAGVGFGLTILWGFGNWDPVGFRFLLLSLAAGLAAALLVGRGSSPGLREAFSTAVLLGLGIQLAFLVSTRPTIPLDPATDLRFDAAQGLAVLAVALIALGFVRDRPALAWARRGLLLAAFLVGAWWVLDVSPDPRIDVWSLSQSGADRLLSFQNPYGQTIPDIYNPGQVQQSYPYPPIIALLQAPFYLVFSDVRVAQLVALPLMAFAALKTAERLGFPPALSDALAALLLLQPRVFFLLRQSWVEPLTAALLACGLWAYTAGRLRWATALFGLALFSKQYFVILFPLLFFLPALGRRRAWTAGAIAGGIALPFFLWNPERFWYGLVTYHYEVIPEVNPNTLAYYLFTKGITFPTYLGYLTWAWAGLGIAYWRRHVEAAPWLALAASIACFFAFGARAYANYYWFVGVLFVLAALFVARPTISASTRAPPAEAPAATPP